MQEKREITLSNGVLEYTLDRGKRKHSYLSISGGKVLVKTTPRATIKSVEQFVFEKESWILKHLSQSQNRLIMRDCDFQNGSEIFFLGQPYIIEIIPTFEKNSVEIVENKLILKHFSGDERQIIESFLWEASLQEISESVARLSELTGLFPKKVTMKKLEKTWGRCISTGNISFNRSLIFYPKKSIDYVVLHELCHLKHLNHSKEFWGLVAYFMPDYKEHQKALKQ